MRSGDGLPEAPLIQSRTTLFEMIDPTYTAARGGAGLAKRVAKSRGLCRNQVLQVIAQAYDFDSGIKDAFVPVSSYTMFSSSLCFSEYRPLPYVCARGSCCRIYEVKVGSRDNRPGNEIRHDPITRATVNMGRKVEHWTGRRKVNFLSGDVGNHSYDTSKYAHSAFLLFVGSSPQSHTG